MLVLVESQHKHGFMSGLKETIATESFGLALNQSYYFNFT